MFVNRFRTLGHKVNLGAQTAIGSAWEAKLTCSGLSAGCGHSPGVRNKVLHVYKSDNNFNSWSKSQTYEAIPETPGIFQKGTCMFNYFIHLSIHPFTHSGAFCLPLPERSFLAGLPAKVGEGSFLMLSGFMVGSQAVAFQLLWSALRGEKEILDSRFVLGGMKGARQEWKRKVERNFVSEFGALHSGARHDKDVNNFKEISIYEIDKCHRSKQTKPEKWDRK